MCLNLPQQRQVPTSELALQACKLLRRLLQHVIVCACTVLPCAMRCAMHETRCDLDELLQTLRSHTVDCGRADDDAALVPAQRSEMSIAHRDVCCLAGSPVTGVNRTAHFVPDNETLERFGRASSWIFIAVLILSGATYIFAGLRDEHTLPRGG